MVNDQLSKPERYGISLWLDKADVLSATVEQLRKDLSMDSDALPQVDLCDTAFEELRAAVLPRLEKLYAQSGAALQVAMYRVDIPEAHLRRTMDSGGLNELAGECVLRALQKVLTRLRFAGRF